MQWDHSVDVLIAGSGNGGLTAALCLYEMGVENVLVIEKGAKYGGTSSYSGGGIWIPCNHYAQAAGAQDSIEEARAYLHSTLPMQQTDPALIDLYLQAAPEMLRFLHDRTRVRYESLEYYPDYFSFNPGAKSGHRSLEPEPFMLDELGDEADALMLGHPMMRLFGKITISQKEARVLIGQLPGWRQLLAKMFVNYATDFPWRFKSSIGRRLACGAAGIARLRKSMLDRKLPLWLHTGLIDLIQENDRIVGAVVERAGQRMNIRAERGVVLAAGGFEKNQQARERYLPKPTAATWSAGADTNQGDAIWAAQRIGAATRSMDSAWWCTTLVIPGQQLPHLAIVEKSLPGNCVVNVNGKRIGNESQNYMTYMKEAFAKHSPENPSSPAYMIFDANYRRNYFIGPLLNSTFRPDWTLPRAYSESGFFAKGESIAVLACKIGVNVAGLERTIANMNEYAKTGKDLEFGRGGSLYDRYYGDPRVTPNPCLAPIATPPFYAVRTELGDFGTSGGLVTDANAQVRDIDGVPIAGLYAVGNTAAGLLVTYPGPGSTLGPAMTFAYLAAKHIAAT
ncbi:MAG TPA: FAD-dependent oxidoreductase [Spongiibacteraceae bacterium]